MYKNIIKIMLIQFLLVVNNTNAVEDYRCSLKCTGKYCEKNFEGLEFCAKTCPSSQYKPCWVNGLHALKSNTTITSERKSAIAGVLQSYLNDTNKPATSKHIT